jgi:hypothetical protein
MTDDAWVVQLDPDAAIDGRTMLDLNSDELSIKVDQAGIQWGDTTSTNQEAQQGDYGSGIAARQYPNRTVTIPLFIGARFDDTLATHEAARTALRQKVGTIKRTGVGVIKRQRLDGPAMYADIVDATITGLNDQWGETGGIETCTLQLECLPDFYGDEVESNAIFPPHSCVATVISQGIANYITTPNFETGLGFSWTASKPTGWSHITSGGSLTTASPSPSAPVGGPQAMSVTATGANRGAVLNNGVLPAGDYTFSVYVMSASGNTDVTLAAGNDSTAATETDTATTGAWQRFSCTFTADGTSQVFTSITLGGSGVLYVDACQLAAGDALGDYVDGDHGGVWAGSAGVSETYAFAMVAGDLPARTRIVVEDTAVNPLHGALWGLQSTYLPENPNDPTAALELAANTMTPLNGTATATVAGTISSSAMKYTALGLGGAWVPILATTLVSGDRPLTHQGTFRVWARVLASAASQMRLAWGAGSLAAPIVNDMVTPLTNQWCLVDLGVVRIDPPSDGSGSEWFGVINRLDAGAGTTTSIDEIYMQPLDDGAGQLSSITLPNPTLSSAQKVPTAAAQTTTSGDLNWTIDLDQADLASMSGTTTNPSNTTQQLQLTGFGFALPAGATIAGVTAIITTNASVPLTLTSAKLIVGGTAGGTDHGGSFFGSGAKTLTLGSSTDLWGEALTRSNVDASNFGIALSYEIDGVVPYSLEVVQVELTVYYFTGTGFPTDQDAVVYSEQTCELATDGMTRVNNNGAIPGPITNQIGDIPRLPPSGLEDRPVRLFLRMTESDFNTLPDSVDSFSVTVYWRPTYIDRA